MLTADWPHSLKQWRTLLKASSKDPMCGCRRLDLCPHHTAECKCLGCGYDEALQDFHEDNQDREFEDIPLGPTDAAFMASIDSAIDTIEGMLTKLRAILNRLALHCPERRS